ncbi:MAG: UvrB/UvrC motif-containing protein [Christensenellales bacterium]|jgi:protein arginine kinase activator
MKCNECGCGDASIHMTTIINGVKHEKHLCHECAAKIKLAQPFSMGELFTGLMGMAPVSGSPLCPGCGMSLQKFRKTGRLGCEQCFSSMSGSLMPVIESIHGKATHAGKRPKRLDGSTRREVELMDLQARLEEAIKKEEYEQAAQLRDAIKEFEREGE